MSWRRLYAEAARRLAAFDLEIDPSWEFERLTAAQKQEVAIAAALSRDARLLILDEPTASLSEPEAQRLFQRLRRLRRQGLAMLYVSHRLDEILSLTDRVVALRDGELVAQRETAGADANQLIQDMVGRPLDQFYSHTRGGEPGPALLELEGLTRAGMYQDITFDVRAGEVVGLAGLVGAGRSELARTIYGMYPPDSGAMRLCGKPWAPRGPHDALDAELVYLPEERKRQGLVLDHSLRASLSIGFLDLVSRLGLINGKRETTLVSDAMRDYGVRAASDTQPVGTLSGGNQQKVLLARWLERGSRVIILDEPTRGVDVGAKSEIHALIDRLAAEGKAILLISSDLPEVLGTSDRVLVMCRGRVTAELQGDAKTQTNAMRAAAGV